MLGTVSFGEELRGCLTELYKIMHAREKVNQLSYLSCLVPREKGNIQGDGEATYLKPI